MPIKIQATWSGLQRVQTSLKLLDTGVQQRCAAAVKTTTEAIAQGARQRVHVSHGPKAKGRPGPGELRDTIRAEMSPSSEFVGYVKAGTGKLRRSSRAKTAKGKARAAKRRAGRAPQRERGIYAMVEEYRDGGAHAYIRPAREAEAPQHRERIRQALVKSATEAGGGAA